MRACKTRSGERNKTTAIADDDVINDEELNNKWYNGNNNIARTAQVVSYCTGCTAKSRSRIARPNFGFETRLVRCYFFFFLRHLRER